MSRSFKILIVCISYSAVMVGECLEAVENLSEEVVHHNLLVGFCISKCLALGADIPI